MKKLNRRLFFKTAGTGIAAGVFVPRVLAEEIPASPSVSAGIALPLELGLASYTTKEFSLDETINITRRVGLKHLGLKSFLPENKQEEIFDIIELRLNEQAKLLGEVRLSIPFVMINCKKNS